MIVAVYMMLSGVPIALVTEEYLYLLAPIVIALFAFWFIPIHVNSTECWIERTTLRINQGVIRRRLKTIPLDRVTYVELIQGPLMRACGIWCMQIQTAGNTGRKAEGIVLGLASPHEFRDSLMDARDASVKRSNVVT